MALKVSTALVRAHYRSSWNRILRGAGFGGEIATWVMFACLPLIMIGPGLLAMQIGLDFGTELAESGSPEVLRVWNDLQFILTVAFALIAGFQLSPVFSFARFGRYPVTPMNLLLAELPAGLFEPIPLLGVIGIIITNAALASRMHDAAPLIVLLALDGLVAMLGLMFIVSALWAVIRRHRLLPAAIALAGVGTAVVLRAGALNLDRASSFAQSIPLGRGYAGLIALRSGELTGGLFDIAVATAYSAVLFVIAAHLHQRRLMSEAEEGNAKQSRDQPLAFATVSSSVARLSLKQLIANTGFRVHLAGPLLLSGSVAALVWTGRRMLAAGKEPDVVVAAVLRSVEPVPWFALLALLVFVFDAEIWMNQFGLDRKGLVTMFSLPIDSRDILVGKLRALFIFVLVQTTLGAIPLLFLRFPRAREIVIALLVFGVEFLVTWVVGMVVSIRFPHAIDGEAGRQIPLYLVWVPFTTIFGTVAEMLGVYAIGEVVATGGGIVALAASLGLVALAFHLLALPRLNEFLDINREKLLSM